ncbi:hypothetical protein B0F90DRAFT_1928871 [Multifurca ochricompacta]|uniref:Uncharacterized protein n=1 Tax=Multifurca ochricompacta TaxID=376703 RepID=A0AAD4QJ96_9AGAM|nr:hypothetical protein B0F90DRAFT_1928871 [Multifurca ochricompacta]
MFSSQSSNQHAFAFSSGSTLSTGRMGRTNGKEVATVARLVSMDVNKGSWSSLASSRGSSKKSGFSGSASCGTLSVGESLARSAKWFQFTGFGLATGTQGTRHPSKASVALARNKTSLVRDSGKWDTSSSPCLCCVKVIQAAVPQVMERVQGQGRDCQGSVKSQYQGEPQRAGIEAQGQGYQKQVDSRLSKRTTRAAVNVQEAHKSRGQHSRGPQEPWSTFKRPARAAVNVQEAHKSPGQHSRGPQVTRGARVQEAS